MKKIFLVIVIFAAIAASAPAANTNEGVADTVSAPAHVTTYYMEIVGSRMAARNNALAVTLELGTTLSRMAGVNAVDMRKAAQQLQFRTMVDAMNFLSENGWRLVDTYVVPSGASINYHWVVAKDVQDVHEVLDGFAPQS